MDDKMWLIELESALMDDDCTVNDIYNLCHGRAQLPDSIRPDVWQICLDVRHKPDQLSQFNGIFDLPFQRQLRADCQDIVEKLGNDDEDKVSVVSDLESILTYYCKTRAVQYESKNGWIELLLPLLSLKLKLSDTFNMFEVIRDTYIPKGCVKGGNVFHLFRLLLQYHEPEVCSLLDTKRITPDQYAITWFQTLFAATCSLPVVLAMWDMYFQQNDPFLIFFLALIMLINGRDQVLALKDDSKEKIVELIAHMPCALELDDTRDFCSLAQYYNNKTPNSFKTGLLKVLFGMTEPAGVREADPNVAQALCLPVSVYELVDNTAMEPQANVTDSVKFFLVDCRPAEQYNSGHLTTAFHVDSSLMLQEPTAFATAIQGLLQAQKQAIQANSNAGGEHLCFMGSGRVDEDQYMHMVVASFLQKHTQYVSMLTGGYMAIHDYFGDHMIDCLEDHKARKCLVCMASARRNQGGGERRADSKPAAATVVVPADSRPNNAIFAKISDTFKMKSAEVRGKLIDYIVNPVAAAATDVQTQQQQEGQDKHVLPQERNSGKRYRNVPQVFSIDEEQDSVDSFLPTSFSLEGLLGAASNSAAADDSSYSHRAAVAEPVPVQLDVYLKQPDVLKHFKCTEVHMNGTMHDCHLVITSGHLIVVREMGPKVGQVISKRALSTIVKITAKRRHRNLITFKYGLPDGENVVVTDMDRFLIPDAEQTTAYISKHIVKQLE